uniref:Reverse transcriptase domain-containing protein n=1 Tax=Tanacetum cinerariifolium TaxID=118510 RepID=A0A6L2N7Q8_TANCI|nr:reverse transcriptase domain-containing protein [Tanacetum cinerariifolium]
MHEKSDFHWTTEAEEAFKQMKQLIAELLMLTAPMEKEELIVYLVAATRQALRGPELNYMSMKKLVLALVHASKRLKRPEEDSPDTLIEEKGELHEPWILFTDGSSCTDGSRVGLILINLEGMEFTYALRFRFDATNNEAEYKTLISRLRIAEQMGVKNLQANVDSRLVANQVNETHVAKEADMICYLEKVKALTGSFKAFSIKQIPRSDNKKADALSKIASMHRPLKANYVQREIHEGSCSMHAGTRFVMAKALRTGYYWPNMHKEARTLIRACQDCQVHKPVPRNPQQKLTPITSPWPFYKWRIDIAGPFPEGPGKVKFLIVAMDYFTKWIEVKPVATITRNQIKKFVWDNIVCRTDVVIPTEIGMPTLRTAKVDLVGNKEAMEINLDLLEEKREEAAICEAKNTWKLGPKWEGPYKVTEALGKGAYKLRDRDGKQLPRT